MSRVQLRDEVMTLLLAGHETTAQALTFTSYLLCQNPTWQQSLREDIDTQGSDSVLLHYVLLEAMRLYPPVPLVSRTNLDDDIIGGYRIPKGTELDLPQWVVHRDPEWWQDPLTFNPLRWTEDQVKSRPKYCYFPFAEGPRKCIGMELAMMEAKIILAEVIKNYVLELAPGFIPQIFGGITLQSKNGMMVRLKSRSR